MNVLSALILTPADADSDGDTDILGIDSTWFPNSSQEVKIAWYENLDGHGNFGPEQVTLWGNWHLGPYYSGHAVDIDEDGDIDLLTERGIFENIDGLGTYDTLQPFEVTSTFLFPSDIDGDGDIDFCSGGGRYANEWYENLLPHPGDANRDGYFDSSDLVQVFQAGKYEDDVEDNATWEEGDWNGDGDFTSSDMVMAFQTGLYEWHSQPTHGELAAAVDWLFAQQDTVRRDRAFVA